MTEKKWIQRCNQIFTHDIINYNITVQTTYKCYYLQKNNCPLTLAKFSLRFLTFVSAFLGCVWATPHGLSKLLHVYFFHNTIITRFPLMKLILNHRKCDGPYQISRNPNDTQNASIKHLTHWYVCLPCQRVLKTLTTKPRHSIPMQLSWNSVRGNTYRIRWATFSSFYISCNFLIRFITINVKCFFVT